MTSVVSHSSGVSAKEHIDCPATHPSVPFTYLKRVPSGRLWNNLTRSSARVTAWSFLSSIMVSQFERCASQEPRHGFCLPFVFGAQGGFLFFVFFAQGVERAAGRSPSR